MAPKNLNLDARRLKRMRNEFRQQKNSKPERGKKGEGNEGEGKKKKEVKRALRE